MLKNQFQIEGYATYPEPHYTTLPIPPNTSQNEVLLMSLFYKNNIMNDSLYKISKVPSPLCSLCNQEEETAEHIIFKCAAVNKDLREDADRKYRSYHNLEHTLNIQPDFIDLLNSSRDPPFVQSCMNIINSVKLRTNVVL